MKPLSRRRIWQALPGILVLLVLPWRWRRRRDVQKKPRHPVIPEKPFTEKELWTPHDYAG